MGGSGKSNIYKKQPYFLPCLLKQPKTSSNKPRPIPRETQNTLEYLTEKAHRDIVKEIKKQQIPERIKENIKEWDSKVAPYDLIVKDVNATIARSPMLFVNNELGRALNILATEGHAQAGHGEFNEQKQALMNIKNPIRYTNTTTSNVLDAIEERIDEVERVPKGFSKIKFQKALQEYNNSIVYLMEDWLKGIEKNISTIDENSRFVKLKNNKAKSFNNTSYNKGLELDMLEFLRGYYPGSAMDTLKGIRDIGFQKYGHQMGGGEAYLSDITKLKEFGIGINDLAKIKYSNSLDVLNHIEPETRIEILKRLGIIKTNTLPLEKIANGESSWQEILDDPNTINLIKNPNLQAKYIREVRGKGVGDDIAIFLSGFLSPSIYKKGYKQSKLAIQSRILGTLSADDMDTKEKNAMYFVPGGQDAIAGLHINGLYKKLAQHPKFREVFGIRERADKEYNLVDYDELVDFTIAAANTKEQHVHSSQRWFYMDKKGTCMVSELLKHAYLHARIKGKEMYLEDMKNFKLDLNKNYDSMKFTFSSIPLYEIKGILNERLDLIIDPEKREEKIKNYFNKP